MSCDLKFLQEILRIKIEIFDHQRTKMSAYLYKRFNRMQSMASMMIFWDGIKMEMNDRSIYPIWIFEKLKN